MKLRSACASQEFTLLQLKRCLSEQNVRMAYKVLGLNLPKSIRTILSKGGADFSDFFPQTANNKPAPQTVKSSLGLLEIVEPAKDSELRIEKIESDQPKLSKIKKEESIVELTANLLQ